MSKGMDFKKAKEEYNKIHIPDNMEHVIYQGIHKAKENRAFVRRQVVHLLILVPVLLIITLILLFFR